MMLQQAADVGCGKILTSEGQGKTLLSTPPLVVAAGDQVIRGGNNRSGGFLAR